MGLAVKVPGFSRDCHVASAQSPDNFRFCNSHCPMQDQYIFDDF